LVSAHVTLLTRLKRIFNIALATDPNDADTHLTLTGTTNKRLARPLSLDCTRLPEVSA
jgi:hypothetical protein